MGLQDCGFDVSAPDGAYYVMAGIEAFGFDDDVKFARHLIEKAAVATVPASSFYHDPDAGRRQVRFSIPQKIGTNVRGLGALHRLVVLPPPSSAPATRAPLSTPP